MKRIAFVFALVASACSTLPALAEGTSVFNYSFFGHSADGTVTFIACDYATDLVQDWMMKFGATDLDVTCTGGIQPYPDGSALPLELRVTYTAPVVGGESQKLPLKIESGTFPGDSDCYFDTDLMRGLLRDFSNVHADRVFDGCFGPDSHYEYDLTVTR